MGCPLTEMSSRRWQGRRQDSFGATDATLTGLLGVQNLMLNDGTMVMVDSKFSATLSDAGGLLSDGDLAVINATTVPEPETWTMLGTGLVGLMGLGRKRLAMWRGLRKAAAGAGCAGLLLVVLPAQGRASVKLRRVDQSELCLGRGRCQRNWIGISFGDGAAGKCSCIGSNDMRRGSYDDGGGCGAEGDRDD